MSSVHEPEPRFLEHLAWQTRTALRRQERFARPTGSSMTRLQGSLRTAALVLVSVFGGAATVVAAERLQDSRAREQLLAAVEVRLEVAVLRHDHARAELERLRAMHQAGLVSVTETSAVASDETRAAQAVRHLELDRSEIEASGRGPRDDLSAPLVGARDYVLERLEISAHTLREVAEGQRSQLALVEAQFANGIIAQGTLEAARAQATLAEHDQTLVDRYMALRRDHLAGATTPEQVELLGMRAEASSRAEQAELRVQHTRRAHELIRARVDAGVANPSEARRAKLDLREAEAALELARMELSGIEARLGR